jgi:DNA mismatch repair protein MutH
MTWEESTFFDKLERKFLFIIFRTDTQGIERLEKVAYWNMPYGDRLEAQKVWEETQRLVQIDATRLPGATENRVAHVRPKAKNAADKAPTPQGGMHTKQGFWLNNSYIESVIDSL